MKYVSGLKQLFIFAVGALTLGFMSAQFIIPSGIDNAIQIIQRILITTTGTSTGDVVMDVNTGANNIYINPDFIPTTGAYNNNLFLTLSDDGFLSFSSGAMGITGATGPQGPIGPTGANGIGLPQTLSLLNNQLTISSGNTIDLSALGGGGTSYWTQMGNDLYPSTLSNNIAIGQNSTTEKLGVSGSFLVENNMFTLGNTDTLFDGDPAVGLQGSTGNQEYRIGINDDGNGFFTNEMSYANMSTNTYANIGINPNYGIRMNRWDDITTFSSGRSSLGVDSNGIQAIGKSTGNDTNMIWYNDNFDTLMRLTNDGYLGVGQTSPDHTLTVSGTFYTFDGSQGFTASQNILGMGIGGAMNRISSGSQVGFTVAGNPGTNPIFDSGIGAYLGFVDMVGDNDRTIVQIKSGAIRMDITKDDEQLSELHLRPNYFEISNSGGINRNLYIDFPTNNIGILTNNPNNTLDIGKTNVTNTLGLRFSNSVGTSHPNRVVGLDANGDLLPLADIATLGGGGGSPSPWQEGAGGSGSVQVVGNGTTNAQGAFSLAGGLGNNALGAFSVVVGGSGNLAIDNGDIVIGGLGNRTIGTFSNPSFPISGINFIGGGINNSIQSGALSNIIGGIENIISNAVLSFIGGGSNNQNYANVGVIVGGSNNTGYGNNTFIGGGDGNFLSGDQSSLIGGRSNNSYGNQSFLGGGNSNQLYGDNLFLGGGDENLIINANSSTIAGGKKNIIDTADLSTIAGGGAGYIDLSSLGMPAMNLSGNSTNTNRSFIGGGGGNKVSQITTTGFAEFIGGGLGNLIQDSLGSIVVGGLGNNIIRNPFSLIGGGLANLIEDGNLNFIVGGENNSIFGGGGDNVIVAGSTNLILGDSLAFLNFIGGGRGNQIRQQTPGVPLDYNSIVGGEDNQILDSYLSNVVGGVRNVIEQGSQNAFIGGGGDNTLEGVSNSNILGGGNNQIIRIGYASIVGGSNNTILSDYGFIAGGRNNTLGGYGASILGGLGNATSGYVATVLGGENNLANGDYSLAGGLNAQALHNNSFVWSDGSAITNTTATNQVVMRARGGYRLFSDSSNIFGVSLAPGASSWGSVSDRNAKENIVEIDQQSILDKFMQLPLFAWNYKGDPRQILHYGPMAQDFNKLFAHGDKDLTLSTQEIDGVMFVAIQALGEKVQQQEQRITELEKLVQSLLDK